MIEQAHQQPANHQPEESISTSLIEKKAPQGGLAGAKDWEPSTSAVIDDDERGPESKNADALGITLPPRRSSLHAMKGTTEANMMASALVDPGSRQTKTDSELSARTGDLNIHDDADESRPTTPAKDYLPSIPPPPSPPPKDNLRSASPLNVPPKDLPPKPVSQSHQNLSPVIQSNSAPKERLYLDPPLTPVPSRPSSPVLSYSATGKSPARDQASSDDERDEIHDLFEKSHRESISEEQLQRSSTPRVSSPTGVGSPITASASFRPPRTSSLSDGAPGPFASLSSPTVPTAASPPLPVLKSPTSPQGATPHRPPPPDDDLPFDFHRFLSQLRHRSADPVAKFLRSFLHEFAKKQWMVHEQVKIVRDFLTFIYGKMDMCEVWREVGDVEMDNAQEGMEKLVMNRLYTQTFSPEIPPLRPLDNRGRADERFPGRRGQHQEDVERDEVLTQKVRIYSWIREEHLDIGDTIKGDGGRRFLDLAVKEMLKIKSYRAPRDKVICVLNCCKVIFGLLRHSKSDESADKFVPLLIYVVLRANPEHLVSNVQYILRFRNPDKLNGEAGYYLSSLMGAIQFIENLDRSSLTITPEEFEKNVEAAVAAIAERPPPSPPSASEKHELPPDASVESGDEKAAVAGLLRTIQKPLTTIGRIFSEEGPSSSSPGPALTPQPGSTPRHSPGIDGNDMLLTAVGGRRHQQPPIRRKEDAPLPPPPIQKLSAEEAAARQASAEVEEARRIGRMEYENVVEILKGMFPALDRDLIGDVVRMKEGRVGLAVDACLALSAT